MSHELRTPLNSLLILSKLLAENAEQNLTVKQVEFASTIHGAGADLLALINDILDLAKIESGTMTVDLGDVAFPALIEYVERSFRQLAEDKKLAFHTAIDPSLPQTLITDSKRLQQVLRNLLANAFKFTEQGEVELRIDVAKGGWSADIATLNAAPTVVAFAVRDTGIGIAPDKHMIIFESFQQADGTTSRKYGGTGLGLSISREIARLLGGEIRLQSVPGAGSTFTLYLPLQYHAQPSRPAPSLPAPVPAGGPPADAPPIEEIDLNNSELDDDRATIGAGDRVLLIIDDDLRFARIMLDLARERGYKGIVATQGDHGLALARHFKPDAITLDIQMPIMDGWTVLDRLKHDAGTRHIPVHIITVSEGRQRGLHQGAMAYLQKPVTRDALDEALERTQQFTERGVRNLLVVEDDEVQQMSIRELIGDGNDVRITAVGSGAEALTLLKNEQFDCMVLDLGLPDMSGFDLIEHLKHDRGMLDLPIIVYTAKDLTPREETELKRVAETIIVKDVSSMERLLAETALFLHRVEANLPQSKRRMLEQGLRTEPVLAGKKVLVVDDDVRNIFALTSVLERQQMQVSYAENGLDSINMLQANPEIEVVLMDIMMPGMDGYEAIREIRTMLQFRELPIIALTAKAMKGDREKCIEAGASDYITKPVDTEQLLSLLRVWLYR
ncbi:MAG TPA: response regulator [Herpetosiphonaceae bacterium]|nr:response regulator [Herpetosiphonaceae bacterium]